MTAKSLLRLRMNERVCLQLPDCGQQVLVKTGKMKGGAAVTLLWPVGSAPCLWCPVSNQSQPWLCSTTYLSWQQAEVETKLHQLVELLQQVRTYGIRAETASFDRWYYVAWFIQQVLAAGYQRVVVPDRADRNYIYQGQPMSGQAIRDSLSPEEFKPA